MLMFERGISKGSEDEGESGATAVFVPVVLRRRMKKIISSKMRIAPPPPAAATAAMVPVLPLPLPPLELAELMGGDKEAVAIDGKEEVIFWVVEVESEAC